jgi:phosphoribosylamine--glycine ligase
MNILLIGSGGREHALAWKIKQSKLVDRIFIAPGNAGTTECGENVDIKAEDIVALGRFAQNNKIDLTVVGPEAPLVAGISDYFHERDLRIFGPGKAAARLEGSKSFAKQIMRRHNIPTASHQTFADPKVAEAHFERAEFPVVVKATGLAAGKGVIICENEKEAVESAYAILEDKVFGDAGSEIVVEEFLVGEEVSILFFTDGSTIAPLAVSQDHKPAEDGDKGPNTGGMGAYSPAPAVTDEVMMKIESTILVPIVHALKMEGVQYRGILYAGLIITEKIPKVLEFNVRLGDPETQPLMMRLKSDIVELMTRTIDGALEEARMDWDERPAVCVVMASGGYPDEYEKGKVITGVEEADKLEDVKVFHAGTIRKGGNLLTNGGRVLGVTALGKTIPDAKRLAYEAVKMIHFDGAHFRTDISDKALKYNM